MKNIFVFVLAAVTAMTTAFVPTKIPFDRFDDELLAGRDPDSDVFVIKKTGERIDGHEFKRSGSHIKIDGNKISEDKISIMQSKKAYSVLFIDTNQSEWFVDRLRIGKISLYTYVTQAAIGGNGSGDIRGDYHQYAFEKERGKLVLLSFKEFANAISDKPVALQKFKELYPKSKIPFHDEKGNLKNLIEVVEIYNN